MSLEKLVFPSQMAAYYMPNDTSNLCSSSADYSGSNSLLTPPSSAEEDNLDFSMDFDDLHQFEIRNPSPLPQYIKERRSLDLSDTAMTSAVFCFIKNFVGSSGTSTVAIDNKIEQAMDLVKSHLMFAVREEVEVLKERIAELMERIALLESENSILRAAATQETLTQLSQLESTYHLSSGDNGSAGGSNHLQGQNGTSGP